MSLITDLRDMAAFQDQVLNVGSASILREAANRIAQLEAENATLKSMMRGRTFVTEPPTAERQGGENG
jgi:hypothetical protein